MNDFRFANPTYLALLLLLAALHLFLGWARGRGRERLLRFVSAGNLSRLLKSTGSLREGGKRLALWLGLALVVTALARPQANPRIEDVEGMSLDIYVLLDLSRSMDAEDVPPSRLRKAKKSIQHLMDLLSGDRVGVIGFAGTSALLVPLTSDYEIVRTVLQNVDTSIIPSQGTDLAGALGLARSAMERGAQTVGDSGAARTNIFLVMSDGEDHGSGKLGIVNEIRDEGGVIFSIAFGTEKGVPIPVRDDNGILQGYKRDPRGNTVMTTVQPRTLGEIAQRGGGQFYFSTLEEKEIEDILARVQSAQRSGAVSTKALVYEEYFAPVLAVALALLLYSFLSLRSLVPRKAGLAAIALAALLPRPARANPLSPLWNHEKRVSEESLELSKAGKPDAAADRFKALQAENPDSPAVSYNLGTYLLEAKKLDEGREQLKRVAKDKSYFQADALYNLAGSYMLEKKKPEAMAGYADLIRRLEHKSPRTGKEQEILRKAKENFALLTQEDQQNPQSQQGNSQENQQNPDQQQKSQQSGGQGDQDKPDARKDKTKDPSDKQKDQRPEEKKDQDEQGRNEKDEDQKDQKQGAPPPRRLGGQPFRERDNISEADAKRILESLKEQEGSLQKKFLKKNGKNSKVNDDANGQDW